MSERVVPDIYKKFGSAANNTTIPRDEKERIYAQQEGMAGAIRRGEMAIVAFYEEFGLNPSGNWMDWLGIDYQNGLTSVPRKLLPLVEQRRLQKKGIPLSKSLRNLDLYYDKKNLKT